MVLLRFRVTAKECERLVRSGDRVVRSIMISGREVGQVRCSFFLGVEIFQNCCLAIIRDILDNVRSDVWGEKCTSSSFC